MASSAHIPGGRAMGEDKDKRIGPNQPASDLGLLYFETRLTFVPLPQFCLMIGGKANYREQETSSSGLLGAKTQHLSHSQRMELSRRKRRK